MGSGFLTLTLSAKQTRGEAPEADCTIHLPKLVPSIPNAGQLPLDLEVKAKFTERQQSHGS